MEKKKMSYLVSIWGRTNLEKRKGLNFKSKATSRMLFLLFNCSFTTSWMIAPLGSSVHGISQAKLWSGLPFPSPRDLLKPGIKIMSLALACGFFTAEPPGKPCIKTTKWKLIFNLLTREAVSDGTSGKESAWRLRRYKIHRFDPWVRKIPWRRK